jgi:hypothetical protein
MKARIHVITLAVADLDRALAFYRDGLGFRTEGLIGTEFKGDEATPDGTTAVFHLDGGLMLSIYPRSELAKDAIVPLTAAKPGEFSIGHAVASRAEVDEVIAQAKAAGAAVTDSPHDRPWGIYSGYFQDPDGHLPPVGDHLESRARPRPVLSGHNPSGASTSAGQRHGSSVRGVSAPRNPCLLAAGFALNGGRAAG